MLENEKDLRLALDQFYPACVGLFLAWQDGTLEVESLRDKLNRQTGMYRFARTISDAGAQKLVQEVCGPAHQCAKRILWQLDPQTPLDDSEASRFNGIPGDTPGIRGDSPALPRGLQPLRRGMPEGGQGGVRSKIRRSVRSAFILNAIFRGHFVRHNYYARQDVVGK